ncbi:MFS transporter [Ferrimonas aestuarii]|uniref:MFS transporter n=1 Tax=Ferrimonas aestuarii TaxID=2569539 RepID=A0A4U1BRY8_9GAMM|nr:MFS transporter [Ferrimonas aestuarii]TKB58393.1 MFS transporter [Ferrimonas aestuarii]
MRFSLSLPLLALGLNQTLLVAALPLLAELTRHPATATDMGLLVLCMNLNLVSYWLGAASWGKLLNRFGISTTTRIAAMGYLASNIGFIAALILMPTNLWILGLCRLATGGFGSAFLPLAHTQLAGVGKASTADLGRLSSALTLGRLLGPALMLLPLPLPLLLAAPLLLITPLLLSTPPRKEKRSEQTAFTSRLDKHKIGKSRSKAQVRPAFLAAIFTTALVAAFQLFALEFVTHQGFVGDRASQIYAGLMLGIGVMTLINQRILVPKLSQQPQTTLLATLLLALLSGCALLLINHHQWWSLALSVCGLCLAISGLPAWYTATLLRHQSQPSMKARTSGLLTRAHTTGHLIGTLSAALFLKWQWTLVVLTALFGIGLCMSVITLARRNPQPTHQPQEYQT